MNQTQRFSGFAAAIAAAGLCALASAPAQAQSAAGPAFQSTVKGPPPGWTGPVFKLSREYPAAVPSRLPRMHMA